MASIGAGKRSNEVKNTSYAEEGDSSSKRMKLTKEHDSEKNKFLLGLNISSSSSSVDTGRRRWSSFSSRSKNSPTSSRFPQIRNRSYILALSPQHHQSTSRSRRNGGGNASKRTIDFNTAKEALPHSAAPPSKNLKHPMGRNEAKSHRPGSKLPSKGGAPSKARGRQNPKSSSARKDSSQKSKSSIDGDDSSVRERTISSSTMSKWTPLSEAAKSLLLDAITYPSSFVGMSTAKRKILQKLMATEVEIVKSKLEMATAPPRTKALRSYSNLRQDITALRSELFTLVSHNNEVEKRIESINKEQEEKAGIHSSHKGVAPSNTPTKKTKSITLPNKDWTVESEDAFCDYLIDFIGTARYSLTE